MHIQRMRNSWFCVAIKCKITVFTTCIYPKCALANTVVLDQTSENTASD